MKKKFLFILAAFLLVGAIFGGVYASAEEPANEAPTMKIKGAALILGNSVDIQYIAELDGIEASDVKLLVWDSVPSEYAYGTQKYTVSYINGDTLTSGGVEYPYFRFTNAGAKMMTKDYYAALYANTDEGEICSKPVKYSILNYAYNKLGKTGDATDNEKLINLLCNMLEYGASAQKYLEYETDRLANDAYYQIKAYGGTLDDGFTSGLFLAGEKVTLNAPEKNSAEEAFLGWVDSDGKAVGIDAITEVTVEDKNAVYTAVYGDVGASRGLEYTERDGSYVLSGIGLCTDTNIVISSKYNGMPVTSIGESAFERLTNIRGVVIPSGITEISDSAFCYCVNLKSVTIPEGVGYVGNYAFAYCLSIASMSIPDSVEKIGDYAFALNTSLKEVEIRESSRLSEIGEFAFSDCSEITSIIIPSAMSSIGDFAFENCCKLLSVYNLSSLDITVGSTDHGYVAYYAIDVETSIGEVKKQIETDDGFVFYIDGDFRALIGYKGNQTRITLPEDCGGEDYVIYDYAFYNNTSLRSVIIPDRVTAIGEHAFRFCQNLESVTVGYGVTEIGGYAFYNCDKLSFNEYESAYYIGSSANPYLVLIEAKDKSLEACTVHEKTEIIGEYAFNGCSSLKTINIPASVTEIRDHAFRYCSSLCTVNFEAESDLELIAEYAFYSCKALLSIEIPSGVVRIGAHSFENCDSLDRISIPRDVISIGKSAFAYCDDLAYIEVDDGNTEYCDIDGNLYTVGGKTLIQYPSGKKDVTFSIPDGTLRIGDSAFRNCAGLVNVILPDSVTEIGNYAFYGCASLESVSLGAYLERIGSNAFYSCERLVGVIFADAEGWSAASTPLSASELADSKLAAELLSGKYYYYAWVAER